MEKYERWKSFMIWSFIAVGAFIMFAVGFTEGMLVFIYGILYSMWVE